MDEIITISKSKLIAGLERVKLSRIGQKRLFWALGFSASGVRRKKVPSNIDPEYPGNRNRAHREMKKRLAKYGMPYGPKEEEATKYSVWLRRKKDFQCAYCGQHVPFSMEYMKQRHAEHVVSLSVGGKHAVENIVPSCAPCNYAKERGFMQAPVVPAHLTVEAWRAHPRVDPK